MGESQAEAEGEKQNKIKNNGKGRTANQVENKEERSRLREKCCTSHSDQARLNIMYIIRNDLFRFFYY